MPAILTVNFGVPRNAPIALVLCLRDLILSPKEISANN
jgi:hypothetical protein